MTLEASGKLLASAKIQYMRMLVRGEALRQFDTLPDEVGSIASENLNYKILGLSTYFPLLMRSQKKARNAPSE